jgi:pre-rRNA-processing protein IPI3
VLLVGTSTSHIHIVNLPSLQLVRTVPAPASNSGPISFISTLLRPPDLVGRIGGAQENNGAAGPDADDEWPVRPVGPLGRTIVPKEGQARQRSVLVKLSAAEDVIPFLEPLLPKPVLSSTSDQAGAATGHREGSSGSSAAAALTELQAENAKLRDQLARAVGFNDEMWRGLVDGALKWSGGEAKG